MADKTGIEWTDATWTPVRARDLKTEKIGWHCEHVTEGCTNCYAETMNGRFGTGLSFKPGHRKDIEIFLDEEMLTQPLRWKKPRRIFVCSMTDLFADFVPDDFIDRVFAVMSLCPQHTFQVLTKRPKRMKKLIGPREILPNVWLGVSVEDQETADERIPHLIATPAAIRFVSYEPALGPVDFRWIGGFKYRGITAPGISDQLDALRQIDWIIAGGESGPGARPAHPDWFRSIRDQCKAADTAFFFKQWGEWLPVHDDDDGATVHWLPADGGPQDRLCDQRFDLTFVHDHNFGRVGKKRAGRLLDGALHNDGGEAMTSATTRASIYWAARPKRGRQGPWNHEFFSSTHGETRRLLREALRIEKRWKIVRVVVVEIPKPRRAT